MQRLNGRGARSLLNGPGAGAGTRRDSTAALHRLDWFFTRCSLAARVLSPPLSFFRSSLYPPSGASSLRCNLALFESSLSIPLASLSFHSIQRFSVLYWLVGRIARGTKRRKKRERTREVGRQRGGRGTRARLNIYLNGSAVSERD